MFKKLFSRRLKLWEAQRYSHVVNSNTWSYLHLMDSTEILKLPKRNRQTFYILPIYITFLYYLYFILFIYMYMLVLKYFNIMEGQNRWSNEQDLSPGSPVGIIGHKMAENCSLVCTSLIGLCCLYHFFFVFFAVFLRKGCSQQAAYLLTAEE